MHLLYCTVLESPCTTFPCSFNILEILHILAAAAIISKILQFSDLLFPPPMREPGLLVLHYLQHLPAYDQDDDVPRITSTPLRSSNSKSNFKSHFHPPVRLCAADSCFDHALSSSHWRKRPTGWEIKVDGVCSCIGRSGQDSGYPRVVNPTSVRPCDQSIWRCLISSPGSRER